MTVVLIEASTYRNSEENQVGYLHIDNLYRNPEILECFALEKIHGTSAHIKFSRKIHEHVMFFSGGESHENFVRLFDREKLRQVFYEKFGDGYDGDDELIIYGEAFGGKQQGMSETYGKQLRFMAFDVKLNGQWLDVPSAEGLVREFGLEFVPYERGPLTLEWLDQQRDRPSRVAVVPDKPSEGVVIRPIRELMGKDGSRFIYKHKRPEFRETKTQREVDPNKALLFTEATAIADEWVTPMRLKHVLDKTPFNGPQDIGNVIRAMQEDVKREGDGEFAWTREVAGAVAKATSKMLQTVKL